MDDPLTPLEQELRALRLRQPVARLLDSIDRELACTRRPRRLRLQWLALPVAAALVVLLAKLVSPWSVPLGPTAVTPSSSSPAAPFKLIAAENILLESRDEGVVTLDDGTAARRWRETYLATLVWKDPRTAASFKWTVPREEFRVVPMSLQ